MDHLMDHLVREDRFLEQIHRPPKVLGPHRGVALGHLGRAVPDLRPDRDGVGVDLAADVVRRPATTLGGDPDRGPRPAADLVEVLLHRVPSQPRRAVDIAHAVDLLSGSSPLVYEDTVESVWRAWCGSLCPGDAPSPTPQNGFSTSVSTDRTLPKAALDGPAARRETPVAGLEDPPRPPWLAQPTVRNCWIAANDVVTKRYPQLPVPSQTGRGTSGTPRPPAPKTVPKLEDIAAVAKTATSDWKWLSDARCIERELDLERFSWTITESDSRREGRRGSSGTAEYTYLKTGDGSEYRLYDSFNNAASGEKYNGVHVVTFEHGKALYYLYREGPAQ